MRVLPLTSLAQTDSLDVQMCNSSCSLAFCSTSHEAAGAPPAPMSGACMCLGVAPPDCEVVSSGSKGQRVVPSGPCGGGGMGRHSLGNRLVLMEKGVAPPGSPPVQVVVPSRPCDGTLQAMGWYPLDLGLSPLSPLPLEWYLPGSPGGADVTSSRVAPGGRGKPRRRSHSLRHRQTINAARWRWRGRSVQWQRRRRRRLEHHRWDRWYQPGANAERRRGNGQ